MASALDDIALESPLEGPSPITPGISDALSGEDLDYGRPGFAATPGSKSPLTSGAGVTRMPYNPATFGPEADAAAAGPTDNGLGDLIKDFRTQSAEDRVRQTDILNQQRAATERSATDIDAARKSAREAADEFKKTLKERKPPEVFQQLQNGSMEWMMLAAGVAAFAGKGAAEGGTSALAAMNGMFTGAAQANVEQYNREWKRWQAESQRFKQWAEMENMAYQTTMEENKYDLNLMTQKLTEQAALWQNEIMFQAANKKDFTTMATVIDHNQKMIAQLAVADSTIRKNAAYVESLQAKYADAMRANLNTPEGLQAFTERVQNLLNSGDPKKIARGKAMIQVYKQIHSGGSPQSGDIEKTLSPEGPEDTGPSFGKRIGDWIGGVTGSGATGGTPSAGGESGLGSIITDATTGGQPMKWLGIDRPLERLFGGGPSAPTAPGATAAPSSPMIPGAGGPTATPPPSSFRSSVENAARGLNTRRTQSPVGTRERPYQFPPNTPDEMQMRIFNQMPPGTWFVNPHDGRVIQKPMGGGEDELIPGLGGIS